MHATGFEAILALLAASVVLVALFRYLHLPPLLAYLVAGIVGGPTVFRWIPQLESVSYLAEFGLVFLMFTIGLEFSFPQLVAMKRVVLGLGGAQVLACLTAFALVAWALGLPPAGAIVAGAILALSSTAVVLKLLTDQLEQHSRHGRAAIGVLLFQDLIVVPFLIVIPALGGLQDGGSLLGTLGLSLLKSVVVFAIIVVLGRVWLRPLFHEVATARSREFFMLTVLLVTLGAAWITSLAGLSLPLGAFLAGIMIGETEYRHQVESDILPFRDILLGLFFITVGMRLDFALLSHHWLEILAVLAAMLAIKGGVVTALGRVFHMEAGVALRTGIVLAVGGEFGFALLVEASRYQVLTGVGAQIVLATVVLSMMIAPLLIRWNGPLARKLVPGYRERRDASLDSIRASATGKRDHVIICGYGRNGQNLAWMLREEGIPSLALDLDPVRVRDARDAGEPVVYGDATRSDVLLASGLKHARALAVSYADLATARRVIAAVRGVRGDIPVIVRTIDDRNIEELRKQGATEVVPEAIEGSLMMGSHVLFLLGIPMSRIVKRVRRVRDDRYRMLRGFFHGTAGAENAESAYRERLHSVTLVADAFAIGKRLADLPLAEAGVTVTGLRRANVLGPEPEPETRFRRDDVLVLYGTSEGLAKAEKILLEG
jgi:CPA2 family monovalent cation:H+ antiporter-2